MTPGVLASGTSNPAKIVNIAELNTALDRLAASPNEYLQISDLEGFAEYAPFAMWVKDCEGCVYGREPIMLYINPAYEKIWRVKADDYIGKPDRAVWPDQVAEQLKAHDIEVYRNQKPMHVWEKLPVPGIGMAETYNMKWPINGGQRIAGINLILPEHGLERPK